MLNDSLASIENAMHEIMRAYAIVYNKTDRDSVFVKELADCIVPIQTLMYVYGRDGELHPGYALEKLDRLHNLVETHRRYWNNKLKEMK